MRWIPLNDASDENYINQASILLENHWPSPGGVDGRQRHLLRCATGGGGTLPSNFVVVSDDHHVIGHACLKPATNVADGLSCFVYSVIVSI
jgi:hypothetical protein